MPTGRMLLGGKWAMALFAWLLIGGTSTGAVIGVDNVHLSSATQLLGSGTDYGQFRATLTAAGHSVQTLATFNAAALAGLDAVFLTQAHNVATAYSAAEISALQSFVSAGGGLAAIAEGGFGTDATVGNFNSLLAPYGVSVAASPSSGFGHTISGFVPHPVTQALSAVEVDFQRVLTIGAPAMDLTTGSGENNILAAVTGVGGQGNVVVISDPGCFSLPGDDTDLNSVSNRRLLVNTTAFILAPEPSGLLLGALAWAASGLRRRGRVFRHAA